MRSLLFVPADSDKKLDKAMTSGADALLLDLEDSVAPENKAAARRQAAAFVARHAGAAARPALIVRVNGNKGRKQKLAQIPLEPGWQTIAFPVEKGWTKPGENQVVFETLGRSKQKVAFSWIRMGVVKPSADQDPLAAATFDAKADAIELAEHASLTWYVTIPEGAHLVADVAGPCRVEVGARAGDASFAGGLPSARFKATASPRSAIRKLSSRMRSQPAARAWRSSSMVSTSTSIGRSGCLPRAAATAGSIPPQASM